MTSYKQLQAQIEQLQQQAEEARKNELSSAISQIKALMAEYGISASDLGLSGKKKATRTRPALAAKYRNSATGETWSGRGKAPKWMNLKSKEQYLIK